MEQIDQIVVVITEEAEVKVMVTGHSGPGCKALSRDIEAALGETVKDEPTREIHQTEAAKVRAQHRA